MKYLKLFVTLLTVLTLVATFAYAGGAKNANNGGVSINSIGTQTNMGTYSKASLTRPQPIEKDAADVAKFNKSGRTMSVSSDVYSTSSPKPRREVTSIDPLAGNYDIPGDFSSISNAVAILNYVGVSANVTFTLTAASYTENCDIVFGAYAGSDTYTVTVQPATGVATTVNFLSTATSGKGFAFNGAMNVTIDGLNTGGSSLTLKYHSASVYPSGDAFGSTIFITGGSAYITVANASIEGIVNDPVWANQTSGRSGVFIWAADTDPYENDYITFDGLTITNASYAFKAFTGRNLINLTGYQITVTNCRVGGAYGNPVAHGGFWEYDAVVNFNNNIFDGINMLQTYWYNGTDEYDISAGFSASPAPADAYSVLYNSQATASYFVGCDVGVFNDNIWRNVHYSGSAGDGMLVYGIRISQGNDGFNVPAKAFNNRIYGITSDPGAAAILRGARGTIGQFHHNSIRLEGSVAAGTQSDCISGVTAAYNNAFSNEITGSSYSLTAAISSGGTFANNAMYATGRMVNSGAYPTTAAAISGGQNVGGVFGPVNFTADLHLDPAGPSSAENIGKTNLAYVTDMDGDTRDTSAGGTHPDAGADEVALALTASMGPDVLTGVFSAPPAGIPSGVPQAPKLIVRNNSNVAVGAFDVTATVSDGYSEVMNVAGLAAGASQSLTFPNWTPASAGSYTFNATSALTGDVDPSNDAAPAYTISVSAPTVIVDTTYTWNASDEGWTRSVDWVRSSSFTKLGGPKDGSSMVTNRPNLASTYTEGAYASSQGYAAAYPGANILTSEWMDLSTIGGGTDLYLSFYQTLDVEPLWDRSWWEYTTDGATWNHIGVQDDPNGVNWYNTSLYEWSAMDRSQFDSATMIQYGLWTTPAPTIFPSWTSNGAAIPGTGPFGWVYSQLKMTSADYPTRSANIRFRFVAFSDAVGSTDPGGWAIDNVRLAGTANPLFGAFHGQVFADLDGDGIFNNADTPFASTKVYLGRFGSYFDSTTTDVSGNYVFATQADLPASYSIKVDLSGYSYTVPASAATTGIAVVNHPADGSDIAVDFGAYVGSVAGMVFNDVNDNATNDTEAGLSGWVVEVHKDSAAGALVGSSTSDVNGAWSMSLPPYATYVAKLVAKTTGRQTLPVSNGTLSFAVSGASGGGSAIVTGQEFGVFFYADVTVYALVDLDGNGHGENILWPAGAATAYTLYKGATKVDSAVLGNGVISKSYSGLDAGSYTVTFVYVQPGWIVTNGSTTHNFTISTSGTTYRDTIAGFKLVSISGMAFVDANGDGLSAGDSPAVGRIITITGDRGGSDTTDASGLFSFIVGPGAHTMSQTLPSASWVGTKPTANGGTYVYTSFSASAPGQDKSNQDFGSFETYSLSGQVFRDYNNDGLMNGADEGFDGVAVSLTGSSDVTTSGGGMFEFTGVGNDTLTLSVTAPSGFAVSSTPTSFTIVGASGTNVSGDNFGLYQTSDGTNKYRTFTLDSLQAWALLKATAFPKTGYAMPNIQVMYNEIYKQAKDSAKATGIMVGASGVKLDPTNLKSKDKGYLVPSKGSEINATFYKKGKTGAIYQTGTARGLDFLAGNSARILKLNKSLAPDKHNNVLLGNMLALSINIAASDWGKTPAGFGDLVYIGGGTYNNMTVAEIATAGGLLMTAWEGEAASKFTDLNAVVAAINAEFDGPLDTVSGWNKTSKLVYTGVSAVSGSAILKAGSGSSPRVHADQVWEVEPTTFELAQNYPNPFNPSTTISFSLPEDAVVTVKVFNMLGQEVATVVDNSSYFSGTYNETFDAKNLTSGVYFYRVTADITNSETGIVEHMTQTKKMLLTK